MKKITDKKKIRGLVILFVMVYFISYITRINYGAVIPAMIETESLTKAKASLALTGSFITYGAGQLVSGYLGDKYQPRWLVFWGLITTVFTNLMIPLSGANPYLMLVIWSINGFAQAFMWPPLVKLMTTLFDSVTYINASVKVSWGSSFGTIAVYLVAPLCVTFASWKTIFYISAIAGIIMAFVWLKKCVVIDMNANVDDSGNSIEIGKRGIPWSFMIISIMFAIVLQGSLRDGVTTWMPTFVKETFNLGNSISILTGVVLPLFGILCYQLTAIIYKTKLRNELVCAGSIFATGFISALILGAFGTKSAVASVLLSALLTGCMHGVNVMLICMVPPYFKKYGNVSFASGLFNSCTYIGSAVSTYGIAIFSEHFGWTNTIFLWAAIALAGTLICFLFSQKWKRFIEE